jgi:hypothetical protein
MSIDRFVADPCSYTRGHVVQFSHGALPPAQAGMQAVATMNHWAGHWTAEEYRMVPGEFTKFRFVEAGITVTGDSANVRIGKGAAAWHTVYVGKGTIDLGIRYLPWKADTVTFMQLDAGARTFFTGPLSGCSIYIGRAGNGTYWVFHANRNSTGASNAAIKATMTDNVIQRLPAPVPIVHSAIYQREYSDFGFVFGQLQGGQWRFYVADTRALGHGNGATLVRSLP